MSSAHVASSSPSARSVTAKVADSHWGDRSLRAGLAARGIVFLIFAELVARVALGGLGEPSTSKPAQLTGVPQALAAQPGGRPVLVVLAIGMVLYALFSLVDAIRHHNDEDPAAKRWGDRALSAWGFVMYTGLAIYAFSVALSGSNSSSSQDNRQKAVWSAKVLRWPAGWFWLGLLAAVLLIMAAFLISRAWRRSFRPRLERERMSARTWRLAMVLGIVGYLGRATLFGIVGGCIMSAAVENDPQHGQGVDGSLRILAGDPAGEGLLWALVVMLVVYGLYMFIETRYRKV
jgi:hypothetical protein